MVFRQRLETVEGAMQMMKREMGLIKGVLGPWIRTAGQRSNELLQPVPAYEGEGRFSPHYIAPRQDVNQMIAPLDLGNTLEGTLSALRESMVGIAGTVDGIRRRGEMALANETLRLGEEMMSLRAQIHGVRMQVHGMMMERNALAMREYGAGPSTITKL